jgi:putative transposase
VKLGIRHERIQPGHPEQNGRNERMHRTLKQETLRPPAGTFRKQQARFDGFRREYNEERPHESLDDRPPSSLYVPSSRALPRRLEPPHYPDVFQPRKVAASGRIRWNGVHVTINHALEGE